MKILMTGFEPFCGERINPSQELLKFFSGDPRVKTLLLPVSYQRSVEALEAELQPTLRRNDPGLAYDFVLLCGQAGGRKHICLERVAINCIDADKADEDGKLFLEKEISVDGPPAYLSKLPLRQWTTELRAKGFNVEISNSAGAFVCNHIYYRAQQLLRASGRGGDGSSNSGGCNGIETRRGTLSRTEVLFVHVPYLTEQLMGKPAETFGMSLEAMKQTIDALLSTIEAYLQNRPS